MNYYRKRHEDQRLDMLKDHMDLFENKKVLDIGCNTGLITIGVAKLFKPSLVLGIDIDKDLIGELICGGFSRIV